MSDGVRASSLPYYCITDTHIIFEIPAILSFILSLYRLNRYQIPIVRIYTTVFVHFQIRHHCQYNARKPLKQNQ